MTLEKRLEAHRRFQRGQRVRQSKECPPSLWKAGVRRIGTVVGFSRDGGVRVLIDGLKPSCVSSWALRFWEPLESAPAADAVDPHVAK